MGICDSNKNQNHNNLINNNESYKFNNQNINKITPSNNQNISLILNKIFQLQN